MDETRWKNIQSDVRILWFSIFHPLHDLQQTIHGYFTPYGDITTDIHEIDLASKNLDDNLLVISKDHSYDKKILAVMDNDLAMVVQHCVNLNIPYVLSNDEDEVPQDGINIIFDTYYEVDVKIDWLHWRVRNNMNEYYGKSYNWV